jgi:hypothetical protein
MIRLLVINGHPVVGGGIRAILSGEPDIWRADGNRRARHPCGTGRAVTRIRTGPPASSLGTVGLTV